MTVLRPLLFFTCICFMLCCSVGSLTAQNKKSSKEDLTITPARSTAQQPRISTTTHSVDANDPNKRDTLQNKEEQSKEEGTPRLLETHLFPEMIKQQRIFTWQHNRYLNTLHLISIDTLINDRFRDYPFLRRDVGATYPGTIGSPVVLFDYFKRQTYNHFYYFTPYMEYAITPDNIPFFNTKTAYTRFEYTGTLFGNSIFEEGNVDILVTANMLPQWNFCIRYRHFGAQGLLQNEATDNSEFTLSTSYSGKRYNAQAGFIYNTWKNQENGGITENRFVLDTIIDARAIDVSLTAASTQLSNYSFFITQSYAVPLNFFRKDSTLKDDGTAAYFGHAAEYTTFSRAYKDQIALTDEAGRNYYNNAFYIAPTQSVDSMYTAILDNKIFLTLQPWSASAIISKLTGGVGYSYISNYGFRPEFYVSPSSNNAQNNFYFYAAATGIFQRYFNWSAFARYDFAGYTQNNFLLDGVIGISFYPLKKGVHLTGNLVFQAKRPDYFMDNTYGNHFIWNNDFDKTIETKIQAKLTIPDWHLEASFGYSLLSNAVYFGNDAKPAQYNGEISVLSGYLKKDFKVWLFHFDHRLLFQMSSHDNVLPLPLLSGNLTYYIQGELVKNVLTAQLGGDMYYNTLYYMYGYNPATGAFHTQDELKIGNYPYMDAFINLKWKHAHIFLKVINVFERWPNNNFFSAFHYIRPERTFKMGISWYFF